MKERHASAGLPSPAWQLTLLAGESAGTRPDNARLHGWVQQVQADVLLPTGMYSYDAEGDRLWVLHGPALLALAHGFGFEPYWATKTRPTGDGFERWRAQFLAANRY